MAVNMLTSVSTPTSLNMDSFMRRPVLKPLNKMGLLSGRITIVSFFMLPTFWMTKTLYVMVAI